MRRIVLTLLALTVLLPSLAQARARWMTDVDLYVRDTCCCPPKKKVQPVPSLPTVQKVCCTLEKRSATALPLASETPTPPAVAPLATPVASIEIVPPPRTVVVTIVPRAQAPPAPTLLAQARGLLL
ncbi:MAG TPA: hypothetical protein VLT45_24315 [Kofleriaceae bacterium]|nr:hypothetical protein [Kofleriaceae bacterium]